MAALRLPRGTKVALDALASAGSLLAGQAYWLTDTGQIAVATGTSTYNVFSRYSVRITGGLPGSPTANLVVPIGKAPAAFTVAAASCSAQARTAATASKVVTLKKRTTAGTETTVGTFTWAASATLATVSISAGAIAAGDMLLLDFGATPDATLADLAFLVSE